VAEWINPAAFANPAGAFGTAPRNLFRGPGTWQIDLGASKEIPLREEWALKFRSEFYNIFNHPQRVSRSPLSIRRTPPGSAASSIRLTRYRR